ncbi:putative RDD family membrane protein YckC [Tahibacter aquaticus]|uniref:Putative RDD family membrane protein YckC n=2 Tax=Tahibacter aquaticus TaxID=520092 RepID=A0A4R6YTT3_9GAMM|nr:putative RDD family membrane protein YckC [Tahibacter aquaticus]
MLAPIPGLHLLRMNPATPQPAHLGWRIAAMLYDLFPVLALLLATGAGAMALTLGQLDYHSWWYRLLLLFVLVAYYVVSWRFGGQTIGMRAWRLQVVDNTQRPPGWSACLLRFFVALLSLAVGGLGFFWCLFERDRRGWHDLASGTRMLRMPKR